MITQTTLSAITPAVKSPEARLDVVSVAQALLPVLRNEGPMRSCHAQREEAPHTTLSPKPEILIANPELEFQLTHRRISLLEISNRKFSQVFDSCSALNFWLLVTRHSSLDTVFLIYGCAIKTSHNNLKIRYLHFSNRR